MRLVTISSKHQITLPKSMLDDLDVQPKNKLLIKKENDALILTPMRTSIVTTTAGSLRSYVHPAKRNKPFSEIMKETKEAAAKKLAAKKIS